VTNFGYVPEVCAAIVTDPEFSCAFSEDRGVTNAPGAAQVGRHIWRMLADFGVFKDLPQRTRPRAKLQNIE
jgi:hypothetical protein